jgi:hypothetical protein
MTAAVHRPCSACGRPELPPPSDIPPSETLRAAMVEVLRFAEEFDALDTEHYSAVTFADWLALACAIQPQRINGKLPLRSL